MASPNVPSSSSRSNVKSISKSLDEFAFDPFDGKASNSFNPLRLPGALGALPMDIMWMILDEIWMGDGPLTHSALCTIRKLSYATNKAVSAQMSYYLRTKKSLKYLSERLNEVRWHPWRDTIWGPMPLDDSRRPHIEPLPIKEDVDSKSNLLTEVICDDCPTCFGWVINRIHGLECSGCNENGWNFVSLAIQAGSLSMLKYFFIKQPETLPLLWSFSNYMSPTIDRPINILIHGKKVQFIAQLLDFLEPRLTKINCPEAFRNGFAETSELNAFTDELLKYRSSFCSFASPSMAASLKSVGVDLCAFGDAYHAAISNGRDFLDYLHENSTLPKNAEHWFNGRTPFEYAVEKNCSESVRWLKRHGGDNIGQIARDTLLNKVASQLTDDSEVMLQELLSAAERVMLDHFESARLVRAIVRGLVPFVKARENKRDAGYLKEDKLTSSWKRMQEDRAIRK
ncbi:hypothetical protein F1880_007841 [Penicillium rolfsii]|nr:hypothetical protein F1880_007841 [Penicillium rolfsii]